MSDRRENKKRGDKSRTQRSPKDHDSPQIGGGRLDRDTLLAQVDSLGLDDTRSAQQSQATTGRESARDRSQQGTREGYVRSQSLGQSRDRAEAAMDAATAAAARPARASTEQYRPKTGARSPTRSRLARVSGGVIPPPRLDAATFRSWGSDAEMIELAAMNALDETQKRLFARNFVYKRVFRARVVEADQMYRSRRTIYDYHHAGCLRENILKYGGSHDKFLVFPIDREMNSVLVDVTKLKQVLDARSEVENENLGTGILRGFMTGTDGHPVREDSLEFTMTPAGARIAQEQYSQRMKARAEADAAARRRAAAARQSPTSSVRAHTGRSSDSESAGRTARPNPATMAAEAGSSGELNEPLGSPVSRSDVELAASAARRQNASMVSMQAHTGKSSSSSGADASNVSGSSGSARSGDGGRPRRTEKRGDEIYKGIFGKRGG